MSQRLSELRWSATLAWHRGHRERCSCIGDPASLPVVSPLRRHGAVVLHMSLLWPSHARLHRYPSLQVTTYTPLSDDGISTPIPTSIDAMFTNSNSSEQTVACTVVSIPESATLGRHASTHLQKLAAARGQAAAWAGGIWLTCTSCPCARASRQLGLKHNLETLKGPGAWQRSDRLLLLTRVPPMLLKAHWTVLLSSNTLESSSILTSRLRHFPTT